MLQTTTKPNTLNFTSLSSIGLLLLIHTTIVNAQTTAQPTSVPTSQPTSSPTKSPTLSPTSSPTASPSSSPTIRVGCPPKWQADSTIYPPGEEVYKSGSEVSNGSGTIKDVYVCDGDPYHLFCPQPGFEPGGNCVEGLPCSDAWTLAWTRLGSCDSSVTFLAPSLSPTTDAPTFAIWDKGGCPKEFDDSLQTFYEKDDIVSYEDDDGNTLVYQCTSTAQGRCYQAGYTPGDELFADAWTILGRCVGTLTPTVSPTVEPLDPWEKGGCPEKYVSQTTSGVAYEAGDVVENKGVVYECKGQPYSGLCAQDGFEPGVDDPIAYKMAWETLGSCTGTLTPTAQPVLPPWEGVGCPPAFDNSKVYGIETVVTLDGVVYECKTTNGRCGQSGYEPGTVLGNAEAWDQLGSCDSTVTFNPAAGIAAWELGGCPETVTTTFPNEDYNDGSIVSKDGIVYECMVYPASGFCKIHPPGSAYGYLGWTVLGSCTGVLPPPAPGPALPLWSFGGCPPPYAFCVASPCFYLSDEFKAFPYVEVDGEVWECISNSGRCGQAGYEPGVNYPGFGALYLEAWKPLMESCSGPNPNPNLGDALMGESPAWEKLGCPEEYDSEVTYEEGDNVVASGNIVYECKGFPDTQFCNLISPEGSNGWPGSLGWTTVGSCDGTIAPTTSPVPSDCGDIPAYDEDASSYSAQDQVYKDGIIYSCKGMFEVWCANSAYAPGSEYGSTAWNVVGNCD